MKDGGHVKRIERLRRDRSLRTRSSAQRLIKDRPTTPIEKEPPPARGKTVERSNEDAVAALFGTKIKQPTPPKSASMPKNAAAEESGSGGDEVMALFTKRNSGDLNAS